MEIGIGKAVLHIARVQVADEHRVYEQMRPNIPAAKQRFQNPVNDWIGIELGA